MALRSLHAVVAVGLLEACVRFGYETLDPPTSSNDASATGGVITSTTSGTTGANGGTSNGSQNSSGGSSVVGGYNAAGNDSGTNTGGYAFGGANNLGGNSPATNTGGSSAGGNHSTAGNDSGSSTGGNALGGASNTGGDNPGTNTGGYTFGGANNLGGNSPATNTGGYTFGGANNLGGNSPATNTGGYTFGGASGGNDTGSHAGGAGNGGTSGASSGGATQTAPSVLGDCCRFTDVVIIEGTSAGDTLLSQAMASALSAACETATTTRQISQDAPGVLDASGRPLIGPLELVVMSGGFVTQKAMAYLDQNDTPVYASLTAQNNRYSAFTRAGSQIFSIKDGAFSTSYDVGIITAVYEPISRTFLIDVYGFNSTGTRAGIFYFANTLVPSLKTDSNQYYVVEWTDQDGDQTASAGDQYVVLASG